jgi:hypothetical protein
MGTMASAIGNFPERVMRRRTPNLSICAICEICGLFPSLFAWFS